MDLSSSSWYGGANAKGKGFSQNTQNISLLAGGGIPALALFGKKSGKNENAGAQASSLYGFSEEAANAVAQKRPDIVNAWHAYGSKYSWPQFLQLHLIEGTKTPSSGYYDDAQSLLSWVHDYDKYGMDPEEGKQQQAFEQGFSDYILNNYIYPDINSDEQRSKDANELLAKYQPELDAVRKQISDLFPGADGQSALLKEQLGYNETVSADQLAALKTQLEANSASLLTQVESLKTNLSGELSSKADALQQQLATLTANVDTLTAAQRQALAAQIASNYQSLEAEIASKQQNLQAELATMGNAVDAQTQARKAALETELQKLYAAQAPLNAIREQGAQTLATSVNLGAESAKDNLIANMAQQGYIGGSSGDIAAIDRSTIAARQQAAQALADARTLNATDIATIAKGGATEGYNIDTADAANKYNLANFGADQTRTLGDYGATQHRTIADASAAGTRMISDSDATTKFNIGQQGAKDKLALSNYGAEQTRAIGDFAANSTKQQADFGASETRNIADSAAQRKLGYFDQDIARRLSSLSLPTQALQTELTMRDQVDAYGQSGLNRALQTLNWFNTNGNTSAPSTNAYTGNTGTDNGFENLGAGLASLAANMYNSNKNWSTPTKTTESGGFWGGTTSGSNRGLDMTKVDQGME